MTKMKFVGWEKNEGEAETDTNTTNIGFMRTFMSDLSFPACPQKKKIGQSWLKQKRFKTTQIEATKQILASFCFFFFWSSELVCPIYGNNLYHP